MWHAGESVEVHTGVLERDPMEERPLGRQWRIFSFVFMMPGDYRCKEHEQLPTN
jgi:hypothetical protein